MLREQKRERSVQIKGADYILRGSLIHPCVYIARVDFDKDKTKKTS